MKMIDLHCDTVLRMYEETGQSLFQNDLHVDIQKLKQVDSAAQFFALFIDMEEAKEKGKDPWQQMIEMHQLFMDEIKKNEVSIGLATSTADYQRLQNEGKIAGFLTIEEGGVLDGKMERLHQVYDMGIRLITLTWNYPNSLGFPNGSNAMTYADKGLTPFGIQVVEEMNNKNMIIDVSHLSDRGFYDVCQYSKSPFVASHSNARTVQNHNRNLTDDMITKLANKGGVTGINFCPPFVNSECNTTVAALVDHMAYLVYKGGEDFVALGTDFDGIEGNLEVAHMGEMDKLLRGMEKRGFSANLIEKIWYKNAERIIKEVIR